MDNLDVKALVSAVALFAVAAILPFASGAATSTLIALALVPAAVGIFLWRLAGRSSAPRDISSVEKLPLRRL